MTGPLRREHAENSFAECVSVRRRRPRSRLARFSPPLRMRVSSEETGAAAGHDVHDHPPRLVRVLYGLLALLRRYRFAAGGVVDQPRHEEPGWSRCRLPLATWRRCCPAVRPEPARTLWRAAILIPAGLVVDRPGRCASGLDGTATTGRGRPLRALDAELAGPVPKSSVHPSQRPGDHLASSRKRTSSVE